MTVLVGIPTYNDMLRTGLALTLLAERRPGCPQYTVVSKQASLLALAHNELLCIALNNRPEITHLLIVHSDVIPEPGFICQMFNDMVECKADVLGAVIPIKDEKGLTSTAYLPHIGSNAEDAQGRYAFRRRRLTLREAAGLPEIFGVQDLQALFHDNSPDGALLANTGMLLIDVRSEFIEHVHFEINDEVFRKDDGMFYADVEPEDWYFSRQLATLGAKVMVTRRVKLRHMGGVPFPNTNEWGAWEFDRTAVKSADGVILPPSAERPSEPVEAHEVIAV